MTPEQFYELDEMEQAETVWEGKHIGHTEDEEHNIVLYKIDNLFIEAYYHRESNFLRKFRAYEEHELLDIYLLRN